jgi:hypothetical protein
VADLEVGVSGGWNLFKHKDNVTPFNDKPLFYNIPRSAPAVNIYDKVVVNKFQHLLSD